jgi:two-component system response regulator HydG
VRNTASDDDSQQETALLRLGSTSKRTGFVLRVVKGPDKGKTLVVDGTTALSLWIGTSPLSALVSSDPTVSRRHLELELQGQTLRIADHGSRNGTRVNGVRIREVLLSGGERIALGESEIELSAREVRADEPPAAESFGRLVGRSLSMRRLYPLCERLAATHVPVIIEGETGTGKEVLAEALHERGSRAKGPFVVFDCTAVPPSLLESALFGHERGAFTGASDARPGVFEDADGGTLLIDELGDLDLGLQATLLRAIERGEVRRIGGKRWLKVDVRVIAATRRDLDALVAAGRFRDDLYYRLGVARIELPALRHRVGDVELLARHFWRLNDPQGTPQQEFLSRLEGYAFPGNVRELANMVARRVALGDLARDLEQASAPAPTQAGDYIDQVIAQGASLPLARDRVMQELERRYVRQALARSGGSVTEAAKSAGIARRYFQLLRARSHEPAAR